MSNRNVWDQTMTAKVIAITAMVVGMLGHLLLLGLCFAGMPNASEKMLAQIKGWMVLIAVCAVFALAASIWLYTSNHLWLSVAVSLATPTVLFMALLKFSP
jgi:hypothetical protein